MNAVAESRQATTVALLGPADAAREQLRHALMNFGAELVFEGSLGEGGRLAGSSVHPDVVLINLEPGVEDDLEAIQSMLDDPSVSVVFNEGEVSSQLTGWDLARWARHLAAKVLGVRDTLPPAPSGAERLPVLDLVPEPGRPVTPAQQQDHLDFDTFAGEVFEHVNEVPASPRLELAIAPARMPEPPATAVSAPLPAPPAQPEPQLASLDFDFSPVASAQPEDLLTEPEPAVQADELEDVDLSAVFESGLDQLTPEDLLARLQMAMGLEPVPLARDGAESASTAPRVPVLAPEVKATSAPQADELSFESMRTDAADLASSEQSFALNEGRLAASRADDIEAVASDELGFDWQVAAPSVESAAIDSRAEQSAGIPDADDTSVSVAASEFSLSFDPVAAEISDYAEDGDSVNNRWGGSESLELDELEYAGGNASIDSESAETAVVADGFDFSAPATGYDDYSLGGTLGLESTADDETIARLAAELDAQAPPEIKPELPGLDFSMPSDEPEPKPEPVRAAAAATSPGTIARAQEPPVKAVPPASGGFGSLSLEPLDAPGLHTAAPTKPATPEKEFDFSHLTLSLEPLEEPAAPSTLSDVSTVGTMRDGTWLRDIGEHVPPPPSEQTDAGDETADSVSHGFEAAASAQAMGFAVALPPTPAPALGHGVSRVVALCASIGGPDALRSFLSSLPAGFPAVFVVIQHLENGYFERLAQQLQKTSKLPVRVPMAGVDARDGEVLVVSSDRRFKLAIDGQIELSDLETQSRYRPCIDDVLRDLSDNFGANVTAIVFSGMAADAVEGAVYLTQRGGEVWAQDPESCVVSSMVDGTRARGVVEFVGSPRELAEHCVRRLGVTA